MATTMGAAQNIEIFRQVPAVREIIEERYLPEPYTVQDLAHYPAGSLGRAYFVMMTENNLTPFSPPIPPDSAANYVRLRSLQTHDLWHLVVGYGLDIPSEAALQAFYLGQRHGTFGAVLISAVMMHAAIFKPQELPRIMQGLGEGYERGLRAGPLFAIRWETLWDRPLDDLRRELGISTEPSCMAAP
jgi:ubiquinone biosynthesis protein Coq4